MCSIIIVALQILVRAHTDPKLNKQNAMLYINLFGYQFHESINFEIKKITIDNFQLV